MRLKLLLISIGALIVLYNYKRRMLVSASTLWVCCFVLIFSICPLFSKTTYLHGNQIDTIAVLALLFYLIGFLLGSRVSLGNKEKTARKAALFPQFETALFVLVVLYCVTAALIVRYVGTSNVLALLNGTLTSKQLALGSEVSNSALIGWMQQLQIPCVMAVWMTAAGKNQKRQRVVCLAIFVFEMAIFSFTRLFLICVLLMVVMFELRNLPRKRQAVLLSAAVASLTFCMVGLNFLRCLGAGGFTIDQLFDLDLILEGTDFSFAYLWFDRLLSYDSPHISGLVYLRAITAFIPRSIWPDKPATLNVQIMEYIDPATAARGGSAGMSVLGEAYAVMDYAGFVIYPVLWGIVCAAFDKSYRARLMDKNPSVFAMFAYLVFCSFILISGQRGDWGTYIIQIVWCYLVPMYLMCKFRLFSKNHAGAIPDVNKGESNSSMTGIPCSTNVKRRIGE